MSVNGNGEVGHQRPPRVADLMEHLVRCSPTAEVVVATRTADEGVLAVPLGQVLELGEDRVLLVDCTLDIAEDDEIACVVVEVAP